MTVNFLKTADFLQEELQAFFRVLRLGGDVEAIRSAAERLRKTVSNLDIHTFYGAFRIDPKSGCQIGHQTLLVQWQRGEKVVIWPPEAI